MTRKYHLSSIFLSIFLLATICVTPAFAAESQVDEITYTASDIEYIDNIFQNKNRIQVYDAQGVNISPEFYQDMDQYYASCNYTQIFDTLVEKDLTIVELNKIETKQVPNFIVSPMSIFTYTATGSKTIELYGISGALNRRCIVTATGNYRVNDSMGTVTGASKPVFSSSRVVGESKSVVDVYPGASSASYTSSRATFNYVCSGDYYNPGIPPWGVPAGYFNTTTITFYGYS